MRSYILQNWAYFFGVVFILVAVPIAVTFRFLHPRMWFWSGTYRFTHPLVNWKVILWLWVVLLLAWNLLYFFGREYFMIDSSPV